MGILDENGKLEKFIPIGMKAEEMQLMAHPPVGKGLIGELMHGSRGHPHPEDRPTTRARRVSQRTTLT